MWQCLLNMPLPLVTWSSTTFLKAQSVHLPTHQGPVGPTLLETLRPLTPFKTNLGLSISSSVSEVYDPGPSPLISSNSRYEREDHLSHVLRIGETVHVKHLDTCQAHHKYSTDSSWDGAEHVCSYLFLFVPLKPRLNSSFFRHSFPHPPPPWALTGLHQG